MLKRRQLWFGFVYVVKSPILSRMGVLKTIYSAKGFTVYMPSAFAFVGIPLGLTILALGIVVSLPVAPEDRGNMAMYTMFPLLIATYILAVWQPWWLKPFWLRWLEKEHNDILHLLWEDARKAPRQWERRVRTQQGLEKWVTEVRRKHNPDPK